MALTKAELVEHVAHETGLTKNMASRCLGAIGAITAATLLKGGEVALPGIGKLSVVQKAERQGRNPRTGMTATIPAKKAVKFKAASVLKDAIN